MKAYITGIKGFVGTHLARLLLKEGLQVAGNDLLPGQIENIEYHQSDILDSSRMTKIISEWQPDFVFHLAGFSSVAKSFEQPQLCNKINVEGTHNVLDAVIKTGIDPTVLVVSSAEVYGIPKVIPTPETESLDPISPYGESRKEQERLTSEYAKLKIVISRSFPHIGPGQPSHFAISSFAKQIAIAETRTEASFLNVGNLEAVRDITDVRDMVKAYLLAIRKCKPGEIYNLCSGKAYSLKVLVNKMLSFSNAKVTIKQEQSRLRPIDIPIIQGDNTKFYKATCWKPSIPIEKTLHDTIEYWRISMRGT